jgi:hypothetical protein
VPPHGAVDEGVERPVDRLPLDGVQPRGIRWAGEHEHENRGNHECAHLRFKVAESDRELLELVEKQGEAARGVTRDELEHWSDQLRELGRRWAQDQKLAVLAAWIALAPSS